MSNTSRSIRTTIVVGVTLLSVAIVPMFGAVANATSQPSARSSAHVTNHTTTVFLYPGSTGPAVTALQWKLANLGYWLGKPDGVYGDSTEQAVFALKKVAFLNRDPVVGPGVYRALARGLLPHPHSKKGRVVEVDLYRDVVILVSNGKVLNVLNTSTGGGYTYTTQGQTSVAITPVGHFWIQREVNGIVTDSLGQLWRPKYFYSGFAIHGDSYVPSQPVSHGCVRVSNEAMDWIWGRNLMPIGTPVWVYN